MSTKTVSSFAERTYEAMQYGFRVSSDVPGVLQLAHRYLAPLEAKGLSLVHTIRVTRSRTQPFAIWVGQKKVANPPNTAALLDRLLSLITQEAVKASVGLLPIHAAAASLNGGGIVMPASTGSGKTTLVAGLVRAGFDYLSDEIAAVDLESGELRPYPKPLTLSLQSVSLFPGLERRLPHECLWGQRNEYPFSPKDLRPRSIGTPCRVKYVIAPRYRQGGETGLRPISRATALTLLLENAFHTERLRPDAVSALGRVVKGADCYRLDIASLDLAVGIVRELVELRLT